MLIGGPGGPDGPARPDARREGLAGVPDAARRGELPHHPHGRLHHGAEPGADGLHGRASCSMSTWPRRSTTAGSPARASSRPATPSPRPAATSIPTMFQGLAPGIMPQSVEQGIANGVSEVRKAVRYQIKYGAKLIKISASGGVMSFSERGRVPAVLRRGAGRHRRRGPPQRPAGRGPRPRRRRHPGLHPGRGRLHRARIAGHRRHRQR